MPDALSELSEAIKVGSEADREQVVPRLAALFGGRYQKRFLKDEDRKTQIRAPFGRMRADSDGAIPYAGLIHPENADSGPYGGMSIAWFPAAEGSLLTLVVGTLGLRQDAGVLSRPGHRRRTTAMRRVLRNRGVAAWSKNDPTALGQDLPQVVQSQFGEFEEALERYGRELYLVARVPKEPDLARWVTGAFFDLYAFERRWRVLKEFESEFDELHAALRDDLFPAVDAAETNRLLRERRFVVLQGPPGTGKTRHARHIGENYFGGSVTPIQFHPAVTYEDFVLGLSPDPKGETLRFRPRRGKLLAAMDAAKSGPHLLLIDEVNRADLSKVLGEAIYLFEPKEIGGDKPRTVELAHEIDGQSRFSLPENLYVLATMNTADRSIAAVDVAIRRRFAFVTMSPDRSVVEQHSTANGLQAFDDIANVFIEFADDESLGLMPGHSYFLVKNDRELSDRFRYELIPLLDDYLRQGLLGPAAAELQAVRDKIGDQVTALAKA